MVCVYVWKKQVSEREGALEPVELRHRIREDDDRVFVIGFVVF